MSLEPRLRIHWPDYRRHSEGQVVQKAFAYAIVSDSPFVSYHAKAQNERLSPGNLLADIHTGPCRSEGIPGQRLAYIARVRA